MSYVASFFFSKTRILKNKSFWLFFLSLNHREVIEPLCECSFLQQKVPFMGPAVVLTALLAYLYVFYVWWCFKFRNQPKNKALINLYLNLSLFTLWSIPASKFFLFEFFASLIFFLDRKLRPYLTFTRLFFSKKLSNTRMEPTLTKILQYLRKR